MLANFRLARTETSKTFMTFQTNTQGDYDNKNCG